MGDGGAQLHDVRGRPEDGPRHLATPGRARRRRRLGHRAASDRPRLRGRPAVRRGSVGRGLRAPGRRRHRLGTGRRGRSLAGSRPGSGAPRCRQRVRRGGQPVRVGPPRDQLRRTASPRHTAGRDRRRRLLRPSRPGRRPPPHCAGGRQLRIPRWTRTAPPRLLALRRAGRARLDRAAVRLGAGDVRAGLGALDSRSRRGASTATGVGRFVSPKSGVPGDQRPLVCTKGGVSAPRCLR